MTQEVAATRTVFVIDDDAANLLLLRRILSRSPGLVVVTESDARAGLERIREQKPDLVLLDLNISGVSGETILREMRNDTETSGIPVVIVSGDVNEDTKLRLLEAGAQRYLEKPYTITEVFELVETLLS